MQMATLFLLVTLMEITMTTGSVTIATALFASSTTHSYSEVHTITTLKSAPEGF